VKELISSGLEEMELARQVPPNAPDLLSRYGQALIEKNQVMNLTAITEPKDVATLHMLDCAALLSCASFDHSSLIDVGTGAGFPGLVLKTLVPTLDVTLLDSLQKRLDWLEAVWTDLGLTQVRAIHGRAEETSQDPQFREQFDFATARAVADLRVLCEMCLPFVKVGGKFLAMKSVDSDRELADSERAIQILGGKLTSFCDYTIPHTQVAHRIAIIEKIAPTPAVYPRRWAKMQNSPL
jgi:16S rRNA (guanine527-N7)-methyltransferase